MSRVVWFVCFVILGSLSVSCSQTPIVTDEDTLRETLYQRLQAERERQIERLRQYRTAGEFPYGGEDDSPVAVADPHFDPDQPRTHRFIGPNGVLCALANLISESGRRDLVDRIFKTHNHFCVALENRDDVAEWILVSGLTKEECILIQKPGFRPDKFPNPLQELELITVDVEELQKQSVIRHLSEMEEKLRRDSESSLRTAVDRLIEHLRGL